MATPNDDRRRSTRSGRTLCVRLTEDERAVLDERAVRDGVAVSALVRGAALDAAGATAMPSGVRAVDREPAKAVTAETLALRGDLRKVANNLNQVARALNAKPEGAVPEKTPEVLAKLQTTLRAIQASLGDRPAQ